MEEIINRTKSQYIIIREKNGEKEYFDGANIYGRDNDGVLRVSKTRWSKIFNPMNEINKIFKPMSAIYDYNKMKDILNGMRKYKEIKDGYNYIIAEIQTTTAIVNYIK